MTGDSGLVVSAPRTEVETLLRSALTPEEYAALSLTEVTGSSDQVWGARRGPGAQIAAGVLVAILHNAAYEVTKVAITKAAVVLRQRLGDGKVVSTGSVPESS